MTSLIQRLVEESQQMAAAPLSTSQKHKSWHKGVNCVMSVTGFWGDIKALWSLGSLLLKCPSPMFRPAAGYNTLRNLFVWEFLLPLHFPPENYSVALAKTKGNDILWTKVSSKIQTLTFTKQMWKEDLPYVLWCSRVWWKRFYLRFPLFCFHLTGNLYALAARFHSWKKIVPALKIWVFHLFSFSAYQWVFHLRHNRIYTKLLNTLHQLDQVL